MDSQGNTDYLRMYVSFGLADISVSTLLLTGNFAETNAYDINTSQLNNVLQVKNWCLKCIGIDNCCLKISFLPTFILSKKASIFEVVPEEPSK